MIEYFVIGILTVLMLGQQVYWSYIVHGLVNKLMSRNYNEYAYVSKANKTQKTTLQSTSQDDVIDPASERQAQELNSIMGIVS